MASYILSLEDRDRVLEAVRKELKKEEWFSGVCMDSFDPTLSLEENIEQIKLDTIYWDAPNSGF